MGKKKKEKVEYRFYEMPADSHILALLGEKWIQTYGKDIDYLHLHNYMEIGYCYYGTGELVLEDTSYAYQGESFSIIPSGALHTTNSTPETVSRWEYLYLDVEGFLNDLLRGSSHYKSNMLARINASPWYLKVEESPVIGSLVKRILLEMTEKKDYYKENVTGVVYQLLVEIARLNHAGFQDVKVPTEHKNDLLSAAIEYIHINYAEEIRVESLAELCYISENHFRRIFRDRVHMSPVEYINLTRIHAACDMLRKTEEPIMVVARKSGFPTLSTFNRNFKKYVGGGVTPYEWRKRPENYEQKLQDYWVRTEEGW
ncbi:MAG: AraC family transcriptional regulator [Eubacteriales bacterium]|nr:AraC family transcriptional regulator [Eubacteriales bacterium]